MLRSIKQTCTPLAEILSGGFNPEIFTANLQQVVDDHRKGKRTTPYSDAELFFGRLTHPTTGMSQAIGKVANRLSGDVGAGAVTSLVTGFGGGKTHTLIGMYHVATQGSAISHAAAGLIGDRTLPEPGAMACAVVIGDTMDVTRTGPSHEKLPVTIWGAIAKQIASPEVKSNVAFQSDDVAAPGDSFLESVIGERPCLILIDEIAQYATRFEAAWPGRGAGNVGAFLMTLFNYAKRTHGVSVVLTLAESKDAFGSQTGELLDFVRSAAGDEGMSADKVEAIAEETEQQIRSVVSRDHQAITPVTPSEIAGVLARRLFSHIDSAASVECAEAYRLQREKQRIGSQSVRPERSRDLYPFHPSFIDLLTDKLSTVPTFQGTRGVLRTLALTVRAIWESANEMPSIHACHVDLTDRRIVDELVGRTNTNNLQIALEKDVGGSDSERSIASALDVANPHPSGAPYHVLVWRTVFLHSLPGRAAGNRFGINEADATVACMMPPTADSFEMSVQHVSVALSDIVDKAYYLRNEDGLCFADSQASINLILRQKEDEIPSEGVRSALREIARSKLIPVGVFKVVGDVTHPDQIPDRADPVVAFIDPYADEILPEQIVLEATRGKARVHQNAVHVLVPTCVRISKGQTDHIEIQKGIDARRDAEAAIRRRDAVEIVKANYAEYGFTQSELKKILGTRNEQAGIEALAKVAGLYKILCYPNADGVATRLISFAGQEGGRDGEKAILDALSSTNEIVDETNAKKMAPHLRSLVFSNGDTPTIASILEVFSRKRAWPLLVNDKAFEEVIKENVASGHWAVFRFSSESLERPDTFHDKSTGFPLTFEFTGSMGIVSQAGAVQRGWTKASIAGADEIASLIRKRLDTAKVMRTSDIVHAVVCDRADIAEAEVESVLGKLISTREYVIDGPPGEDADQQIMTKAEGQRRNQGSASLNVTLNGTQFADFIHSVGGFKRLPALAKKWKSTIGIMAFTLALPANGRMQIIMEDLSPETIQGMDEYLDTLQSVGEIEVDSDAELSLAEPMEGCGLDAEIQTFLGRTHA